MSNNAQEATKRNRGAKAVAVAHGVFVSPGLVRTRLRQQYNSMTCSAEPQLALATLLDSVLRLVVHEVAEWAVAQHAQTISPEHIHHALETSLARSGAASSALRLGRGANGLRVYAGAPAFPVSRATVVDPVFYGKATRRKIEALQARHYEQREALLGATADALQGSDGVAHAVEQGLDDYLAESASSEDEAGQMSADARLDRLELLEGAQFYLAALPEPPLPGRPASQEPGRSGAQAQEEEEEEEEDDEEEEEEEEEKRPAKSRSAKKGTKGADAGKRKRKSRKADDDGERKKRRHA